jgi:molybdopterin biosynthesis enzyme
MTYSPIGSDISIGEEILSAGSVISSSEIGLLASIGRYTVDVVRKPVVAVLSTGNEVNC